MARLTKNQYWAFCAILCVWSFWLLVFNGRQSVPPEALSWSIPQLGTVALRILLKSVHFGIGSKAWNTLLPSGGHIIHTREATDDISTHTVTMFHQLRCLQIIQEEYVSDRGENVSLLSEHCLNYLRQIALCQMDTRLEAESGSGRLEGIETFCQDWTVLYEEAEKNHASFSKSSMRDK